MQNNFVQICELCANSTQNGRFSFPAPWRPAASHNNEETQDIRSQCDCMLKSDCNLHASCFGDSAGVRRGYLCNKEQT